ncbi:MAG: cyclase family protein [Bacteriovoracaceae bacterium]
MKLIDISPLISSNTAVFPGDTPFQRAKSMDFVSGHHLELSSITTTVHIGAHADAPSHYDSKGESIEHRDLNLYYGKCQVIEVSIGPGERIFPEHIKDKSIKSPRVLFKTNSFPDPNKWNDDFNSLSPELVDFLAQQKVILVGIDTPSVDPAAAKELTSHQAIYKNDMAILEGIFLEKVKEGIYTLIAFPLRIKNSDASPVRAVLCEEN